MVDELIARIFDAAAAECAALDAAEAVECRSPAITSAEALWAVQTAFDLRFQSAYRRLMSELVEAAYEGNPFAVGFVGSIFGDLEFDADGEEFGHSRTLPADKSVVMARVHAVDPMSAKRDLHAFEIA